MQIVDDFITINFPLGIDLPNSFEIDVLSLASSFALETCSSVP
ncbi:hypothetical protein [Clostridium botulinum]